MSKNQEQAVNGFTFGKLGQIVFFKWKGKVCQRAYVKPSNPNTEKQQLARARFSTLGTLATALLPAIAVGLKVRARKLRSTEIGEFISINNQAVTGTLGDLEVDYESIKISDGGLVGVQFGSASFTTPLTPTVPISAANSDVYGAKASDKVYVAAYCPDTDQAAVSNGTTVRTGSEVSVTVPAGWQGLRAYLWGFVLNDEGTKCSRTEYIGYGNVA